MGEVDVVVAPQAPEVGHHALVLGDVVVGQGPALPLGKGEGDLEDLVGEITGSELGRALDAIEVVIEARELVKEHGGRDPLEVDVGLELVLEGLLDELEVVCRSKGDSGYSAQRQMMRCDSGEQQWQVKQNSAAVQQQHQQPIFSFLFFQHFFINALNSHDIRYDRADK